MNRIRILSPRVATIGAVAGKPRPLIVNPPSESLLIQTMSWLTPYFRSTRSAALRGWTMNAPEQAAPDLVGRVVVRVVHVRADRPGRELVGERGARLDRVLRDVRDAVHRVREPLAVEVDAGRLVEVVREDRPDSVALDHVDPRARPRAVEAERVDRLLLARRSGA